MTHQRRSIHSVALTFALAWLFTVQAADEPAASARPRSPQSIVVAEIEGTVEFLKPGTRDWSPAKLNQSLAVGDSLRTGERSRVAVRLADRSIIRKGELTTIEIKPPPLESDRPLLDMKPGLLYFFSRERRGETRARTPTTTGAIRGTEFTIAVAQDGTTVLTLIDGEVDLENDHGTLKLVSGQQATVAPGRAPIRTAVIQTTDPRVIQWCLYYPAVLDSAELDLSAESKTALGDSLNAYAVGDVPSALRAWPTGRKPSSDGERIYLAALLLAVGQVEQAEAELNSIAGSGSITRLAGAVRRLIAAVQFQPANAADAADASSRLATEWLADSYYQQSQRDLLGAWEAAWAAAQKSPDFSFAWARIAELEFSFGRIPKALEALAEALKLAPRNAQAIALEGFLAAAENRFADALGHFDRAIAIDGALGNAWLGRGLVKIRGGDLAGGRADLQMAAALEPQRAVLRSYLGKALHEEKDWDRARHELDLARKLDALDPTAWLYSALLNRQANRINRAVDDLERSKELNANRSLFRSKLLLDRDQAVRGANLAGVYRDAGMFDVSVREASRAVGYDYGNAAAHLFLANSYDALRDPRQVNLRYETPWFSEFLVANLLAPVGANTLSQQISQQEYSKLFTRDRLGVAGGTEYQSRGDWSAYGSQFGTFGGSSYAIDAVYATQNGQRANEDAEQLTLWAKFKQQLTPQDSLLVMANYYDFESGDVRQVYDPSDPRYFSSTLRFEENQEPNVFAGYHREWSPGSHTLLLVGHLDDEVRLRDPDSSQLVLARNPDLTIRRGSVRGAFDQTYRSTLDAWSAELQHIWQTASHTLIAGSRYQNGSADTTSALFRSPTAFPAELISTNGVLQSNSADLERLSLYGYYHFDVVESLRLIGGLSYDRLVFPNNIDLPPIDDGVWDKDQLSPKAGFIWTLGTSTWLRGSFTRSLGGVYYDTSVRLEPAQVAGFVQALRSAIPESEVGPVAGTEFQTAGLGFDHKFATGTYVGVEAERLDSEGERRRGAFDFLTRPALPTNIVETLDYEEESLTLTVNQLIGTEWSVGARYRLTDARLDTRLPQVPVAAYAEARGENESTLQQFQLFAIYNHRCGFFAETDASLFAQSNRGYAIDRPGDTFWQFNAFAGYRFPNRIAEAAVGLLNISDRDYRLNPLNLHPELPRDRTFVARVKFNF